MALADRDYYGEPEPNRGSSRLTPMVKILLILNIGIFVLDYLILPMVMGQIVHPTGLQRIGVYGAFSIQTAILEYRIWEFITFQFMHGGFLHILLNSVGLFVFGPWVERYYGSRSFLIFYLICGIGGAVFYALISYAGILPLHVHGALVGASAGIFGCIMAVAMIAPNLRVQLIIPPVELSMRQFAIGIIVFSIVFTIFKLDNAGGHAGHLGGVIAGYLLMRFAPWLKRGSKISSQRPRRARYKSKLSPRSEMSLDSSNEIDAILDKVSAEGFQSLTDKEKAILKKAAEGKG